jgi:hypothetical protein
MEESIVTPPESEAIDQVETTTENPIEETQQTIGEISEEISKDSTPSERMVPEHALAAANRAKKAAERELQALRQAIENGATQQEIASDVDDIAREYDIDPGFMKKLVETIKLETEQALDAKYASKLSAKEKAEKFDDAFNKQFNIAIERGPEFQAIANVDVIKTLATLPQNKNKTVSQLLEETYGNALTGKRTIETTQPGGGKDPEPLDLRRAETDINYFQEVMADPKKKAQYNEQMLKKGF